MKDYLDSLKSLKLIPATAGVSSTITGAAVDLSQLEAGTLKLILDSTAGGQATASLTTALAGSNNDIVLTAAVPGPGGNAITLALVDPMGNSQALGIVVTGNAIVANLATGLTGTITTTATALLAALAASAPATALATGALAPGNDGTGVVTALTATHLSGGASDNTLTGQIQDSADGSTNWTTAPANQLAGNTGAFAVVGATTPSFQEIGVQTRTLRRYIRFVGTVAGTNPSFNFSVTGIGQLKQL